MFRRRCVKPTVIVKKIEPARIHQGGLLRRMRLNLDGKRSSPNLEPAMWPTTLARASIVAHQICLVLLVVGILGFAALTAASIVPSFSRELELGERTLLEVHNGTACPLNMPSVVCYGSGLGYRREFRIVYHTFHRQLVLVAIGLPNR
jgi:hypothetical protein